MTFMEPILPLVMKLVSCGHQGESILNARQLQQHHPDSTQDQKYLKIFLQMLNQVKRRELSGLIKNTKPLFQPMTRRDRCSRRASQEDQSCLNNNSGHQKSYLEDSFFGRPLLGLQKRQGSLNSLSDLLYRAFCEMIFCSLPEGL